MSAHIIKFLEGGGDKILAIETMPTRSAIKGFEKAVMACPRLLPQRLSKSPDWQSAGLNFFKGRCRATYLEVGYVVIGFCKARFSNYEKVQGETYRI